MTKRPLLVFADDWGRHPSSAQHLIRHLLPEREVLWVNTIGTRPPRLDMRTAGRVIEKLRHWTNPRAAETATATAIPSSSQAPALAPRVISPRMWPSFATPFARRLNLRLLTSALVPEIAKLSAPPIAITTLPIVADLVRSLPVHRWVYYCVDDFSQWPGYDGATMQTMERELVPRMNQVIAVSEALVTGMARLSVDAELLTHGVDLDHWRAVPQQNSNASANETDIVFWGVIDRRMDSEWMTALSSALERRGSGGRIVLIGPMEDPDPALLALPRVTVRPPMPYDALPAVAARASVLIMPYADLPATRAMQPLKLKEYLATGRPAVVRALPATTQWAEACDVCESAQQFVARVLERASTGTPAVQLEIRRTLDRESWRDKAARLARIITLPDEAILSAPQKCHADA